MKISIITVVLNGAKTISNTLDSISFQSYKNYEHIVIDGGSTDGTLSLINNYKGHKILIISEPDQGIYDAMNKGIAFATGDLIGFINSDDEYYDENVLETIVDVFNDCNIDTCYGDLVYVDSNNKSVLRHWKSSIFEFGNFFKGWAPPHPTFYIRSSALKKVGNFNTYFSLAADFEFMMRCLEVFSLRSTYIPKLLVKMRTGGATNRSISAIVSQNRQILEVCSKYNRDFNALYFIKEKLRIKFLEYYNAFITKF